MTTAIYIGNFNVPFSTESHVRRALLANDVEVIALQESSLTENREWADVAAIADDEGVDFVLWTHTHYMAPEAAHGEQDLMLQRLSEVGVPSIGFHLDRWWGLDREHQVREEPFFRCTRVVTADGGHEEQFAEAGVNHVWMPPAVLRGDCTPGTFTRSFRSDYAFVGNFLNYHPEWRWRRELVMETRRRFGGKFRTYPRGRAIRGQELNDLYASVKVVLGDSCLVGGATRYWSDRVPETIGRGGFLVHPEVEGLAEHGFVNGETIATFPLGDIAAAHSVMRHYAEHDEERERVRAAGQALVHTHHTYEVRMQEVIALAAEARGDTRLAAVAAEVLPVEEPKPKKKPAAKKAPARRKATA